MSWVFHSAFSIHPITASYLYDSTLYVGNEDNCLRVWNVETSSLITKLVGHTGKITGITYIPKYDLILSSSLDGCIITWFGNRVVNTYQHFRSPKHRFASSIYCIDYSSDEDIITIGLDKYIITFSLLPNLIPQLIINSGKPPFVLRQAHAVHNDRIGRITTGGRRVFAAGLDRSLSISQLLDIGITKRISSFGDASVSAIVLDEYTGNLITGDYSGSIKMFAPDGLHLANLLDNNKHGIKSMYFDAPLRLVWAVASNGSMLLIDPLQPGTSLTSLFPIFDNLPKTGSDSWVFESVRGNITGDKVLAVVNHSFAFVWKWSIKAFIFRMPTHVQRMASFFCQLEAEKPKRLKKHGLPATLLSPGINIFAGGKSLMCLHPSSSFLYNQEPFKTPGNVTALTYNNKHSVLLYGTSNEELHQLSLKDHTTSKLSSSPHITFLFTLGSILISIHNDSSICIWNLEGGIQFQQKREKAHDAPITAACFASTTSILLTCDDEGIYRQWTITPSSIVELALIDKRQHGPSLHASYSPTADLWIIATADQFVRGWNLQQAIGPPTFTFNCAPCQVTALAAGTNQDVYIALDDHTIRLYSLLANDEICTYTGHTDFIQHIVVFHDYHRWVSVQWGGDIFFWSARSESYAYSSRLATKRAADTTRNPRYGYASAHRQPASQCAGISSEPLMSLFEKTRKTLLIKRREEERQTRQRRKTQTWKRLTQIQNNLTFAMDSIDSEGPT